MNIYDQIKKIHPDLKSISFDGDHITLIWDRCDMLRQEFKSTSDTYQLIVKLEDMLLNE